MSTKRFTKLAAAAVAAGGLTGGLLVTTTVAAQAVQNADADQDFLCEVTVTPEGGVPIGLGDFVVGVNTIAELPDTYTPGQTIPSRQVDINLGIPEDLRRATYNTVQGRSAEGSSTDTTLGLRNSGTTASVPLFNLGSEAPSNIPATVGTPWVVPAVGTVPPVPVPAGASGPTQVLAPTAFTVDATIYTEVDGGGDEIAALLDCEILDDSIGYRRIGTILEEGEPASGAAPVAKNASASTAPGDAVEIRLPAATDADSDAATLLGYQSEQPANGRVSGAGRDLVYTPEDGFTGTDSFEYTVTDETGNSDTATVTVDVEDAKATSTTKATAPKRSKAGRPVQVKVVVRSDAAATGKATIKLGRKTLDTGNVRNGKTTLTVPGRATKKLRGAKTFVVAYSGSDTVEASSTRVKVTFTR